MFSKKKIIIIELVLFAVFLVSGVTYSLYTTNNDLQSTDMSIAQFVFNANKTDTIELPFGNIVPGETLDYTFSVANNLDSSVSEVTVEYQIILKTLHNIPLRYELRYVGDVEELVLTCDENVVRNDENVIVCEAPVRELAYGSASIHDYRLSVIFPSIYNDAVYANLVDYLDLEINSWQKIV